MVNWALLKEETRNNILITIPDKEKYETSVLIGYYSLQTSFSNEKIAEIIDNLVKVGYLVYTNQKTTVKLTKIGLIQKQKLEGDE